MNLVIAGLGITAAWLVCVYRIRRFRIADFARRATGEAHSPRDATFALARAIFTTVKRGRDPFFVTRLLASLGASPSRVLDEEACCSGITRLFIACLDTLGIRAAQITVYRQPGPEGAHCLAQVEIGDTNVIIDVDYGIWLRHPEGGAVDLKQLRAGVVPVVEPFVFDRPATYRGSTKTRFAGYPDCDYYRFDFSETRTANWTESALKRVVYKVLNRLTHGRVNYLLLPPILEWPEVLLALSLCALALAGLLAETIPAL